MAIFLTICGHFCGNDIDIFHKIEIQMVILKCFVCLNLNWIKSYEIISGQSTFLHTWKCTEVTLAIFSKFCGCVMTHLIRENAGKRFF